LDLPKGWLSEQTTVQPSEPRQAQSSAARMELPWESRMEQQTGRLTAMQMD